MADLSDQIELFLRNALREKALEQRLIRQALRDLRVTLAAVERVVGSSGVLAVGPNRERTIRAVVTAVARSVQESFGVPQLAALQAGMLPAELVGAGAELAPLRDFLQGLMHPEPRLRPMLAHIVRSGQLQVRWSGGRAWRAAGRSCLGLSTLCMAPDGRQPESLGWLDRCRCTDAGSALCRALVSGCA